MDFRQNESCLRVRQGPLRKPPGFQVQLVCASPWTNGTHPGQITAISINSNYGLYVVAFIEKVERLAFELNFAAFIIYLQKPGIWERARTSYR